MKKKALWKDSIQEIRKTFPKFLSILLIIFLGIAFFAGIRATGPDMIKTAQKYYDDYSLADIRIISTMGLTDDDVASLKEQENLLVSPSMSVTSKLEDNLLTLVVADLPEEEINRLVVISGRLPVKSGEIILDNNQELVSNYQIGDTITFIEKEKQEGAQDQQPPMLAQKSFTVVGFANSPKYIQRVDRSIPGDSTVAGFAYVIPEDIKGNLYTEIYLRFNQRPGAAYEQAYDDAVNEEIEQLKQLLQQQPDKRIEKIKQKAQEKITEAETTLTAKEQELADAKQKISDGEQELANGQLAYKENQQKFETEIAKAKKTLAEQEQTLVAANQQLQQGLADYQVNMDQLTQSQKEIGAKEQELIAKQAQVTSLRQQLEQLPQNPQPPVEPQLTAKEKAELLQQAANGSQNAWQSVFNYCAMGEITYQEVNSVISPMEQQIKGGVAELEKAQGKITAGFQELTKAKQKLTETKARLNKGTAELKQGKKTLQEKEKTGRVELADAKKKLEQAEAELAKGKAEFEEQSAGANEKISEAKAEIEQAKQDIEALKAPTYYYFDRTVNPGYQEFESNADRIAAIAKVFPVFFFFVAALISFSAMNRMVVEQRTVIGIYKGLGYRNFDIAQKYLIYAISAALIGSVCGIFVGQQLFPRVIFNAYQGMYQIGDIIIRYYPSVSVLSIGLALLCTVSAVWIALHRSLKETGAQLLRPKPPKTGHRILLEKATFIWSRLSFNQKITMRNIFRYKGRNLMTVLGVAGCSALILTGFGISDSISGLETKQFGDTIHYSMIVTVDQEITPEDYTTLQNGILQTEKITHAAKASFDKIEITIEGMNNQFVNVLGVSPTELKELVSLVDAKTNEDFTLPTEGVVISEKLARILNAKVGQEITLTDLAGKEYPIAIAGVTKNYVQHWLYMTPELYKQAIGEKDSDNSIFITTTLTKEEQTTLAQDLMEQANVTSVHVMGQAVEAFARTVKSLDIVTTILVISAALLAFIVLYNLSNINISERLRELSTIKVLGFYPKEVSMYIFQEMMILLGIGILLGFALGNFLLFFVLRTAEIDTLLFPIHIAGKSYVYAGGLTIIFSSMVMLIMHQILKKIKMVEALKAED